MSAVAAELPALAEVLRNVGRECEDVAERLIALELVVLGRLARCDEACAATAPILQLQEFDLSAQRLRGLADFLGKVAEHMAQDMATDLTHAFSVLTLDQLRRSLAGLHQVAEKQRETPRSLGCELF